MAGGLSSLPWWAWALLLFGFSFCVGILAVMAGIGGAILYVPTVAAIFPIHLDFARGAGLLVSLTGALSAAPGLLRSGMASLRLALPMALAGALGALFGASIGLALPGYAVELFLGAVILVVVGLMCFAKRADHPEVVIPDRLASRLGIGGEYMDHASGAVIQWQIHRLKLGFVTFLCVGFMAGMFGLGAGWANVPVLNMLLGAPLKVSMATSILIIAVNGAAATWVYLNKGAILPIIAVPSAVGMMLGTRLGAKILRRAKPKIMRRVALTVLAAAGLRSILSGSGVFQ